MPTNDNILNSGFDNNMLRLDVFESEISGELTADSTDNPSETVLGGSLESQNFLSGTKGYFFDEDSFELNSDGNINGDLIITGSVSVGSLHIPNQDTTDDSFHTNTLGDSWWGATETDFNSDNNNAVAYILSTGETKLQNSTVVGVREIEKTYAATIEAFSPIRIDSNGEVNTVDIYPKLIRSINDINTTNYEYNSIMKYNDYYFGMVVNSAIMLGKIFDGETTWVSVTGMGLLVYQI